MHQSTHAAGGEIFWGDAVRRHRIALVVGLSALLIGARAYGGSDAGLHSTLPQTGDRGGPTVHFMENRGQLPDSIRFYARSASYQAYLTDHALLINVPDLSMDRWEARTTTERQCCQEGVSKYRARGCLLRVEFIKRSAGRRLTPLLPAPFRSNFFISSPSCQSVTGVMSFGEVVAEAYIEGLPLRICADAAGVTLSRVGAPGATDLMEAIEVKGCLPSAMAEQACIQYHSGGRPVLRCLQDPGGNRLQLRPICASMDATGGTQAREGERDIFPTLISSTYLGGGGWDTPWAATKDAGGDLLLAGRTRSDNFPATPGVYDTTYDASYDAFVARMTSDLSGLIWATYLGGPNTESFHDMVVDEDGTVVVSGYTSSSSFPTTSGAFDRTWNGGGDLVLLRLSAAGDSLVASTLVGGTEADYGTSLAIAANRDVVVFGHTDSPDFPVTPGAFDRTHNGGTDAIVLRMTPDLATLLGSTYFGGSGGDAYAPDVDMAIDDSGDIIFTGRTGSSSLPTTPDSYDPTFNGPTGHLDGFVAKLDGWCRQLRWATYLGGADGSDETTGISLDAAGNPVLVGYTLSSDFPITEDVWDSEENGGDAFISKMSADGRTLLWSTFLGGSHTDEPHCVLVDEALGVVLAGFTQSLDFPTAGVGVDTTHNGGYNQADAFVAVLSPDGRSLRYGTYLGGGVIDEIWALCPGDGGLVTTVGETWSSDFPVTEGAYDTTHNGYYDAIAIVLRISDVSAAAGGDPTSQRGILSRVWSPNPIEGGQLLQIELRKPCYLDVSAFRADGRAAVSLFRGAAVGPIVRLAWPGTIADHGSRFPGGIYLVRVQAGMDWWTGKVVVR